MPPVHWEDPAPIRYGTALGENELNARADVPGGFRYQPPAGTVLPVGEHTLETLFNPADPMNYQVTDARVTLVVLANPPTISLQLKAGCSHPLITAIPQ